MRLASPSRLIATIIVWALIVGIAPAVVAYRVWVRNHPVVEDEAAVPWQQVMVLDLSGDMAVYGARAFGGAMPTTTPAQTEDLTPEQLRAPEVALRLAALHAEADKLDKAAEVLAEVPDDPDAGALAAALAEGASQEDLDAGLDRAARLQPLWVRRAYRLALAEAAGEESVLAQEGALADAEAPFRVLKVMLAVAGMVVVGLLSIPALLAAVGFLAHRAWSRSQAPHPPAPPAPYAPAEPGLESAVAEPSPAAAADVQAPASPVAAWSIADGLGTVIAFLAASAVIGGALAAALPTFVQTPLGIFTAYSGASVCAFALIYAIAGPRLWREAGWLPYSTLRAYGLAVWAFLALPALVVAAALLQRLFMDELPMSENPALAIAHGVSSWGERVLMLITLAVAAPLVEETLFRGVLWAPLRPRLGATGTILLTSAIFGAMHFDFMVLPQLFLIGVGCAVLRELTGSLKASMILHGLWNGGAYIMITLLSA